MMKIKMIRSGSLLLLFFLVLSCNSTEKRRPETHTVEIYLMKFTPANLTVQSGDSIVWVNKDLVMHDVTALDSSWTSGGVMKTNDRWGQKADKSSSYYCSIHKVMKGSITLKK